MLHLIILAFSTNFCSIKSDLSGNTVSLPKVTICGIFDYFLSTQNVNEGRFARNVECDFFCDFQTPRNFRTIFDKFLVNVQFLRHCVPSYFDHISAHLLIVFFEMHFLKKSLAY